MSNKTVGMKVSHESMYGHQGIKKSDFGVGDTQAVKMNPHKFISVYAIAKNEEKHVERWYECMKEADEICVLDTGSTDDTVRLLKEKGVNVSVKKYDDFQFDVARNDARKLVSEKADILFAIDLDETIAPGWRKTLERAWTAAEDSGSTPSYAEYRFKTNLENGEIAYINKIHSAKDGVWVYGIHEALRFKGKEHICIEDSFCLEHHPDKGKSRGQYLRMLERAVEREPDSARMRLYYGRELANRGKFDDALREFDKCLQLSLRQLVDIDSVQRSVVMYYCAKIYSIKGDVRNAELWCLRSVLQSKRRDNTFLLATIYERLNDNSLANKAYEESVSIKEHNRGYPEDPEAWTAILFGRYAKSLWAVGEYQKSKLMAEEAHRLEPGNKDYLNLVNEIKQKMPRTAEK